MKRARALSLLCAWTVATVASADVREVIVAFKTHFDIGYTDLACHVVQRDRTTGPFKNLEASWAEHTAYIEAARDRVSPVLDEALQTLARSTGLGGWRLVVFNPLPWKRDGIVPEASRGRP